MSDLSAIRSRLGLADDADEAAVLAALDALTSPPAPPAVEPTSTPEPVAAAAPAAPAADKDDATDAFKVELAKLSGELAEIKAAKAANDKAAFFGDVVRAGKIAPADRGTWEKRYDRDPALTAEILASIAPGTAVPVSAAGYTADPTTAEPDDDDASLFRPGTFATKEN